MLKTSCKHIKLVPVYIFLMLAASCVEHLREGGVNSEGTPVTVSAVTIADGAAADLGTTRASTDTYGGSFGSGDQFYATFTGCTVDATTYTVGSPCTPLHQPFLRAGVASGTLRAYFPYYTGINHQQPAVTDRITRWTVQQDQTATYYQSDLMYAEATIPATGAVGTLQFTHRMAQLRISVTNSIGATITAVNIVQGYRTCTLSDPQTLMPNATTGFADATSVSEPLNVWAGSQNGSLGPQACLLPPQPITKGLKFIEVQTTEGTAYYALTAEGVQLATGKKYEAAVTLNRAAIGATTAVEKWGEVDVNSSVSQSSENNVYQVGNQTFQMNFVKGGDYSTLRSVAVTGQISDYYIGQTEVTVGLYRAVMGDAAVDGNTEVSGRANDCPMTNITAQQFKLFVDELNSRLANERPAGWRFAIPTEAQWEYAARGGSAHNTSDVPGAHAIADAAWYSGNSGGATHPVARKQPNELGLYDMVGNVHELCRDHQASFTAGQDLGLDYLGTLYTTADDTNPAIYRGGSFKHAAGSGQSKAGINGYYAANTVMTDAGLRLALVPVPGAKSFSFNGSSNTDGTVQTYTVPANGNYMLEVWGAQGGSGNGTQAYIATDFLHSNSLLQGGKGGYAKSVVWLKKDQTLYIYVGGKGSNGYYGSSNHNSVPGGWNGGGAGGMGSGSYGSPGAGGGATMICTADIGPIAQSGDGTVQTVVGNANLLIIAGGGGGFAWSSSGDGGGVAGDTRAFTTRYTGPVQQPWKIPVITNQNENEYEWYYWCVETNTGNTIIHSNGVTDISTVDDYNADGQACLSAQSWGMRGADTSQRPATYAVDGEYSGSGIAEGAGGGGGGYYGGNARQGLNGVGCANFYNRRPSVGGCGGSCWAGTTNTTTGLGTGTQATRETTWTGTRNHWLTEVGVRTGHGAATITPM